MSEEFRIRFFTFSIIISFFLFYPPCLGAPNEESLLTPLDTGIGISPGVFITRKTKGGELSLFRVPKIPCYNCFWYYGIAVGQTFGNQTRYGELELGTGSFFGAIYLTAGVRDDTKTTHLTGSIGGQVGILPGYFYLRHYESGYEWGYLFKIPIALGSRRR